jgi:hypothetical protein
LYAVWSTQIQMNQWEQMKVLQRLCCILIDVQITGGTAQDLYKAVRV